MEERQTLYERMRRLGIVSWSLLGLGLILAGGMWVLSEIRVVVPPLVVAIAIIYLLNPFVTRLERLHVPRVIGSVLAYLLLLGLLVLVGFRIVPVISVQASEFADRFPDIVDALGDRAVALAERLGIPLAFTPTMEGFLEWWSEPENRDLILSQVGRLTELTRGVVETLLLVILAPVLAFYLLVDLPGLQRQAARSLPPRLQAEATYVAGRISRAVGGFVRGQLLVALMVGILSSLGLWLIDLPFWLLIGMVAGILNLVPFLGPWVGGILAVVVALTTRDLNTALLAVLVFVVVQQTDNHLISPNVLRVTVQLHPATIILALLAGAALAGLLGLLVAVPVVAAVKILLLHLWRTRILGESWERATEDVVVERPPDTGDSLLRRLRRFAEPRPDQEDQPVEEAEPPER